MFGSGLVVRQKAVSPASQLRQKPQPMLNGRQTMSPTLIRSTALPISITSPRFSCPNTRPCSKSVRPSYICRSDPQMFVVVIFTSTSVGRSIFGSGTSLTLTWRGPSYTTAFMIILQCILLNSKEADSQHPRCANCLHIDIEYTSHYPERRLIEQL